MHPPINQGSLIDLLADCFRRQTKAQERLYHAYYPFARHIALSYADDSAGAEDIVQDAFIKLFQQLEKAWFKGDFEKYFRRIVVNTGIDHYRARRTRSRFTHFLLQRENQRSITNEAYRSMEHQDVNRFLQRLPPRYRLVFNLYVIEGFTHGEIAERLGISVGTSKSNLAKARKLLRKVAGAYFKL